MLPQTNVLLSVIIITRNRPFLIGECVRLVLEQDYAPSEVIVVDASDDDATRQVLANYPGVRYARLYDAAHQIPRSRNEGIKLARGEIIAFIDDDSMVQPGWMRHLVADYVSSRIGGVGGLVLAPGETAHTNGALPSVTPTGSVLGSFDILTPGPVPVDHLRGCNMSFARKAIELVGGFDVLLDQSNFRDETDLCVAIRRAGFTLIYDPNVRVTHLYSAKDGFQRDEWEDARHYFSITKNTTYFRLKHFFSPRTLAAVFIGGACLAAATNLRRFGRKGLALVGVDWSGRIAGARTFLQGRTR